MRIDTLRRDLFSFLGALCLLAGRLGANAQAPDNDALSTARPLTGTDVADTGTTEGATAEADEPTHGGYPALNSCWWTWTSPGDGEAILDLRGSVNGAAVEVYTGKYLNELLSIGGNAFGNADDGTAYLRFLVHAGISYQSAADTSSVGITGALHLHLKFRSPGFPPEITVQPEDQSLEERTDTATFGVEAISGTPLRYQWRFNGGILNDATNATLVLPQVRQNQAGGYDVVVSNGGGSVASRVAQLTVGARPGNDDFANRFGLTGSTVSAKGTTLHASREDAAGEPPDGLYRSVWWRWTAPASLPVVLDLVGSFPGTVADIFTGSSLSALSAVAAGSQLNPDQTSRLRFLALAGTTYQLKIATHNPEDQGAVSLLLQQFTTDLPPEITQQPQDQDAIQGVGTPTFCAAATSGTPMSFQWQFNGVEIPNATNKCLELSKVGTEQGGEYSVSVGNGGGTVASDKARLKVHSRPTNDDFANRIPLLGTDAGDVGTSLYATREDGAGEPAGAFPFPSVWWTWTAPGDGYVVADLTGSSGNTTLDVFTGDRLAELLLISGSWNRMPIRLIGHAFPQLPGHLITCGYLMAPVAEA